MRTACLCLAARSRWRLAALGCVGVRVSARARCTVHRALMYAPIVIVGATAGVHIELPPHAIDLPLKVAVLDFGHRMDARALQEQVGDDQPAEVGRVRDAARFAER